MLLMSPAHCPTFYICIILQGVLYTIVHIFDIHEVEWSTYLSTSQVSPAGIFIKSLTRNQFCVS